MKIVAPKNRPLFWSNPFGRFLMVFLALVLCSCVSDKRLTICGVPIEGTPWQLAASIHDNGDGTFVPTCIDQITTTKAYISGYQLLDATGNPLLTEQPATLICDLENGQVVCAVLHCETLDNE